VMLGLQDFLLISHHGSTISALSLLSSFTSQQITYSKFGSMDISLDKETNGPKCTNLKLNLTTLNAIKTTSNSILLIMMTTPLQDLSMPFFRIKILAINADILMVSMIGTPAVASVHVIAESITLVDVLQRKNGIPIPVVDAYASNNISTERCANILVIFGMKSTVNADVRRNGAHHQGYGTIKHANANAPHQPLPLHALLITSLIRILVVASAIRRQLHALV